jgi:hypothetical protein
MVHLQAVEQKRVYFPVVTLVAATLLQSGFSQFGLTVMAFLLFVTMYLGIIPQIFSKKSLDNRR